MISSYDINYLKYTNNISAQFFRNMLFYIKLDAIYIIMSGITDPFSFIIFHIFMKVQLTKN